MVLIPSNMGHLTNCKISVSLSFLEWNDFNRISELVLPTLILDTINHFIYDPVQKRETNWNFTGCHIPHFMIVLILCINLLNLSWIKRRKKSIFEANGAYKIYIIRKLRILQREWIHEFHFHLCLEALYFKTALSQQSHNLIIMNPGGDSKCHSLVMERILRLWVLRRQNTSYHIWQRVGLHRTV